MDVHKLYKRAPMDGDRAKEILEDAIVDLMNMDWADLTMAEKRIIRQSCERRGTPEEGK